MALVNEILFKITNGMNLDIDIQSSSSLNAFKLFNIKTQTTEPSISGDLVNEKGNKEIKTLTADKGTIYITGTIVGLVQCTSTVAVIFVYNGPTEQIIYKLTYIETEDYLKILILAKGDFNITLKSDIQGLFVYESSEIQKVYWVDGINQLRYINIADSYLNYLLTISDYNFITDVEMLNSNPTYKVNHKIRVERKPGGGVFTAGVIQYAFTYFNQNSAETNIVDMTPLYYIADENRGIENDETVGCSFMVYIDNPDTSFEYLRLYSIQRNSYNGVPVVKIVNDIKLK